MTTRFKAVVENGLLRPTEPVSLRDGATVELVLVQQDDGSPAPTEAARILAEIAATPLEAGGREFWGRDHDQILYGEPR
ncbi:MAG: DUF104 domain-containing protein [Phycisphaerales bacterium]|nr:MAG: DUF104 domain-containing protein [Phycisphaerales bacterium]